MLVLLPPSETKAARRRGASLDLARLASPELTADREAVLQALAAVSVGADAAEQLKVSPALTQEIARNTRLREAATLPVRELYTGVLYDALDLAGLDPGSKRRATHRLAVVSALFGVLRLGDRVPPYRLSMGVSLPGIGPLAAHWRAALGPVLTEQAGAGLVVDCRSSTYAAAWTPHGQLAERWLRIRVPGASHQAKHTRGLVARELCRWPADPRRPQGLVTHLEQVFPGVVLHPPTRPGAGWDLDVPHP